MNINYKQPQFELFPSNATHIDDADKPKYLLANVTLSIENLVICLILCILMAVSAFVIGVEQGKRIVLFEQSSKIATKVVKAAPKTTAVMASTTQSMVPTKTPVKTGVPAVTSQAIASTANAATTTPLMAAALTNSGVVQQNSVGVKPYTIQVASYKAAKFAQREADNLKGRGWETQIIQKGSYVILCVGRFTTRSEADSFARRLRPTYKDFVVRRL